MLHRALRIIRTYHNLKQTELAKLFAISNSYLSEIEGGSKQPSIDLLKRYSDVFKIPMSSIMLFSEIHEKKYKAGDKIRIEATNKILQLLEWINNHEEFKERSGN